MVVDGHHNEFFLEDVHLFSPPLDTLIPLLLCKFPGIGSNVMEFNDIFSQSTVYQAHAKLYWMVSF